MQNRKKNHANENVRLIRKKKMSQRRRRAHLKQRKNRHQLFKRKKTLNWWISYDDILYQLCKLLLLPNILNKLIASYAMNYPFLHFFYDTFGGKLYITQKTSEKTLALGVPPDVTFHYYNWDKGRIYFCGGCNENFCTYYHHYHYDVIVKNCADFEFKLQRATSCDEICIYLNQWNQKINYAQQFSCYTNTLLPSYSNNRHFFWYQSQPNVACFISDYNHYIVIGSTGVSIKICSILPGDQQFHDLQWFLPPDCYDYKCFESGSIVLPIDGLYYSANVLFLVTDKHIYITKYYGNPLQNIKQEDWHIISSV